MRFLLFHRPRDGGQPYVLAETIDRFVAEDLAVACARTSFVVPCDVASDDPSLAAAVQAWIGGDDRRHTTDSALLEAALRGVED